MYDNRYCNFWRWKCDQVEAEKILKNRDLQVGIQRMWNVKSKVIPVITGAIETISKSLRQYLSNTPGRHEIKALQKTATLGIAHKHTHTHSGKC
jgi:actin-like ATPase involved in cell morphogenesis